MPPVGKELTCVFFPDLQPWEREGVQPIIRALKTICAVREIESTQPIPAGTEAVWVLAKNWKKAVRKLHLKSEGPALYASVFGLSPDTRNLFTLLWRKMRPREFTNVKLFAHSPINFRFFSELEGLRRDQVVYLPLCTAPKETPVKPNTTKNIMIGTFGPFVEETNLNFIVNIAHYVIRQRPDARFRILGSGTLHAHLTRMIADLGLDKNVSLVETMRTDEISSLDILLYAPLRNDHFLPLIFGAAVGVTPVSTELPGLDTLIQDGKTGFVVPVNETKPMGELVIRLLDNPELRTAMAAEFRHQLFKKLDEVKIAQEYAKEIFGHSTAQAAHAA